MGKNRQGKGNLNSYTIRETGEDVRVGDWVLFKPFKPDEPSYVASIVERLKSGKVRVRWCYRPDDTSYGREHYHGKRELFLSDHYDIQSVDSIVGKCTVHPMKDYIKINNAGNQDYFTRYQYSIVGTENLTLDVDAVDRFCVCGICQLPYNPDTVRVQCYYCNLRFHPACTNTDTYFAFNLVYHSCDKCSAERQRRYTPEQEWAEEERLLRIVREQGRR